MKWVVNETYIHDGLDFEGNLTIAKLEGDAEHEKEKVIIKIM